MKGLSQQFSRLSMESFGTEKFDQNDITYDSDGAIMSGSVSALVHRLLPTRTTTPDSQFIFTLIVNIRTVISPQELMQKIVQNCMFSQNEDVSRHGRERMFAHIFRLCHEWVTTIPHDFRTEYMRTRLNELLTLCCVDSVYKKKAADLQSSLKATLNKFERYEKAMENLSKKVEEGQPPQPIDILTGILPLCQSAKEVAQQLAHIEYERMSMVGLDEIVHALAHNQLSELGKLNGLNSTTSAITFYIDWFNRLSSFAATEVLRHTKRKHRVQVIEYLIDVARECCEIGNFNSLMAIVAGLSLPCVGRLKRTWCRVDKQKLHILQHQIDPSGNFVSYRATLKAAQWRAETAKSPDEKTIIPFFVLLLKDLYLIYHGSMRVLPNGHLNFVAFAQLAVLLNEFHEWKRTQCAFPKNPQVLHYLLVARIYTEKQAELMSFECETPEGSDEREQWKKLKSKLVVQRTKEHFEPADPADEDVLYQKDIIVIPNHFPKELNFFCYPHNDLIKDRLCFGQLDAFAIACPDDNPPMQLVPFCLAFKTQCSSINYPPDEMCEREFIRYRKFCTHSGRRKCKNCHYDVTCACEPYECLWKRYGFETAKWCQRYELFCDEKKRRQKGSDLLALVEGSPRIHYRCMHLFNLPKVICDPFRRQYDYQRCMKFLFDCELVSEFKDESKDKKIMPEQEEMQHHRVVIDVTGDRLQLPAAVPSRPNGPIIDPGFTKELLENDKKVLGALEVQKELETEQKLRG